MARVVEDTFGELIDGAASDVFGEVAGWFFVWWVVVELRGGGPGSRTTLGDDGGGVEGG